MVTFLFNTDQFIYGIKETIKTILKQVKYWQIKTGAYHFTLASFWKYQFQQKPISLPLSKAEAPLHDNSTSVLFRQNTTELWQQLLQITIWTGSSIFNLFSYLKKRNKKEIFTFNIFIVCYFKKSINEFIRLLIYTRNLNMD